MNNYCDSVEVRYVEPSLYDTVLKIPEDEGEKIGNALWQEIKKNFPDEEKYEILAPGIGTGRFVIPFLLNMSDTDRQKIQVYAIENDPDMSSYLSNRLQELKLKEFVTLHEVDFERYIRDHEQKQFHACFAFFIFHHLKAPLEGIKQMVSFLKPNGLFFFSEEQGDKVLWDTSFQHVNYKELQEIVNENNKDRLSFVTSAFSFSRELARQGLLRYPLISAGENTATIDYLEGIGLSNLWDNNNKKEFPFCQELKEKDWSEIIEKGMFSFLPGDIATKYAEKIYNKEKLLPTEFTIKNRLRIYAFQVKKPSQPANGTLQVTEESILSQIKQTNALRVVPRIIQDDIYKDDDLFKNELSNRLQVMVNHDFFEKSVFVYVASWALHKGTDGDWRQKVPEWISKNNDSNGSEPPWNFIASIFLYLLLSKVDRKLSNFKITDFIFHDIPDKSILTVNYCDNCSEWDVNFDRFGKVEKITIPCSKKLVSQLRACIKTDDITNIVQYLKDKFSGDDIKKTRKGSTIFLNKVLESLNNNSPFNTESILSKMKEISNDKAFQTAINSGETFFKDISKFTGRQSWGFSNNKLKKLFVSLLYAGLVGSFDGKTGWSHLYYILGATHSSKAFPNDIEHSSFCWTMMCDNKLSEIEERNLRQIAESIGQIDSIWSQTEKVTLDFVEHSRRIAIISILVDSFAHNIAAHSLSAMVWFLKQQRQKQIDSDLPYDICKKKFSDLKKGIENSAEKEHLLDLIKEIDNNFVKIAPMEGSVQYAQYLCNKAAFWSGVTRDFECGGEIRSWYDVLKDFAENSIYLGTIAHAEGIHKVRIKVGCGEEKGSKQKTEEFAVAKFDVTKQGSNTSMKLCNGEGCKKTSWKNLDKDEWRLFLPNGIVGLHALYTIFENTLRNIKHAAPEELKKAKEEGIEFNIFIESVDDQHFNTTIWLGNKSKIMEEKKDKEGNVYKDKEGKVVYVGVDKRIDKLLKQLIISESGTPRMGGNSQDKICASMLYNNVFSKVDVNDRDNPKPTHPWIHVKRDPENGQKLGVIKRSFDVWKGRDKVEIVPDGNQEYKSGIIKISDLKYENPARFKFVIVPKSEKKPESESGEKKHSLKEDLAERGIVRIMDESEYTGDDLDSIYRAWNEKWIKCKEIIIFAGERPYIYFAVILENNGWIIKDITEYCDNLMFKSNIIEENKKILDDQKNPVLNIKENNIIKEIPWKHKGTKSSDRETLEWRSHGVLFSRKFIPEPKPKENLNFVVKNNQDEFIETLLTNIEIYDNRIFERVKTSEKKRPETDLIDLYAKQLFLHVNDEKMEKTEFIKKTEKSEANFFIIHLSYIESMNFTEKDINKFIETCGISLNYNTKLVITTGRGRGEWHNSLVVKYKKHVLFKAIDSLLAAVEDGLMLNDDFQVKYNLVKVLFGS